MNRPNPTVRRDAGFTLIEMVVVIFIIGIIVSFATLSVRHSETGTLQEEVRRLQALTQLASDEAVLQAEELAIEVYRNGYRFLRLEQADTAWQWTPVEGDAVLRPRCLPDNVTLAAEIEGAQAQLEKFDCAQMQLGGEDAAGVDQPEPARNYVDEDKEPPRIFLLSSGEMTPFAVTLSLPEPKHYLRLEGELTGKLQLFTPGDDKERS
jgi:general secretion pathway protein H